MSEIFNDQLTDPSSSSLFNSTSQYTSSNIGDTATNINFKNDNKIYNTFDTQVIENIITHNPIKITENYESLDPFQLSADTYSQQATVKQTLSTDSQPIQYKQIHQLPSKIVTHDYNQYKEYLENQNQQYLQNDSGLSAESMTSQSVSKVISDDESEQNSFNYRNTKDLSNQRFETFPDGDIVQGNYERIDLSKNELSRMSKPIPNGVKQLILNDNRFAFLTNLKGISLTLIELKNNRLISVQGVKSCINLKHLDVSNNFLSDDQLDDLKELKELEVLLIKHNHLKNESIVDNFNQNKKLKILDLSQNDIEDIIITHNCYIRKLYLQQNKIESFKVLTSEGNEWKSSKPKIFIKKIDISQNGLQYFDAKHLISLRELHLQDNQLLDLDLSNNYKIKKVNVNRNQLSSIKFKEGEQYPLMKRLFIGFNRIIKISFISQHLLGLEDLDVSQNNIDDHQHFFDNISKLKNLMKLNMEGNPFDEEAKKIQIALEQKGNQYKSEFQEIQQSDEPSKAQNTMKKEGSNLDQYQTKERESRIFNSHFTSVSNGKRQFQYNSQDNGSNLLNCQLSPGLFNSIDQQFMTLKSEGQQSVDCSMQMNQKKPKEENLDLIQNKNNNGSHVQENSSEVWSNQFRNNSKGIYSINEEEEENAYKDSQSKAPDSNQFRVFSDQIFESNLFKKKPNQSDEKLMYESEAKILNDQLNFSVNEEDEFSSKNLQSRREEIISQINLLQQQEQSEQISSQFRKKNTKNESYQNESSENNLITDKQKKFNHNSERNRNEKENYKFSQEGNEGFNSSLNWKDTHLSKNQKTFNDIDEEERQLKLAIETMESSLTDGSLLSEITNEMTKEYRKNLNQLKEYYKDKKGQKTLKKEDGEALLQMNQALMQKIIVKLGDDPSLQKNPYFLKCKQLIQQNYETFEPNYKICKSHNEQQKENDFNISNRQSQKLHPSSKQFNQSYHDTASMCSPKFQNSNLFNDTINSNFQNNTNSERVKVNFKAAQQIPKKENTSNMNVEKEYKNIQQPSIDFKQIKFDTYRNTNIKYDNIPMENHLIENEEIHKKPFKQSSQYSTNSLPRQINSLMSTQEQNSVLSNNVLDKSRAKQNIVGEHDYPHKNHSRNNSNHSMNNNNKTLNLFDTTMNQFEQQYTQPLFTETSQIPALITNSSPFINKDNKRQYSQSSRLPTSEIEHLNNIQQYHQQNQTCRIFSKERIQQQNQPKKNNNSAYQSSINTYNNESNFSVGVSEDEFYSVFKEYLLIDDININSKNRSSLAVRKKFIKLIVREVLSNCDLFYSTQIIDQIIYNMMPNLEEKDNIRFDQLYSLFIKSLYSTLDQSNNAPSEQSPISKQEPHIISNMGMDIKDERSPPEIDNFEERIKTPPQIITFRSKLREGSMEKKYNNTRQSQNNQSLSSNSHLTSEMLSSLGNIQGNEIEQQIYLQQQLQLQNIYQQNSSLSPISSNQALSPFYKQQQQDNSIILPNTQQIINSGDNSFLSTHNKKNTLIPNEKSNASFELFLQKNKYNNILATPKAPNIMRDQYVNIHLTYEDVYSQVTPFVKYILEKSSIKSQQRQSSPYSRDSPSIISQSQSNVKQIEQTSDEFKAVGSVLSQLKFEISRVAKSTNYQALHVQQAKQSKIIKHQIQDNSNKNKLASYVSSDSLLFNDYIILFHTTELTSLGKIVETSFHQFYGDYPSVFSLKKNIAIQEQEKYLKKKKFNISTQNQTHTHTSILESQRSKWRMIVSKVFLGKCLIDQVNTLETFDVEHKLEFLFEQGYQSVFIEKSDVYLLFDNQLATPLYLCEYYHNINY